MESARRCFRKFLSKDKPPKGVKKGVTSNVKEGAKVPSAATKQRVDAAKQYIEKHYKEQIKNLQQRKERRDMLEKKLADSEVSKEEQNNLLKYLEKKETEYMRLQRHKMGADDFEPMTMIGKGEFGEEVDLANHRICGPESLGIVVGIVFMVLAIVFQYFNFTEDSNWLVEYNAALASICFMTLLGFVDDVLDVPWRVKLVLPSFAALPQLMAYAGHTTIVIPKPIVPFVGLDILDLGWVYKLYMGLLAVFCTNSINIHAGINGLEVGQTVVIACAILIHNAMQIGSSKDSEYQQAHAFSIYLVHPFLATSLALLSYNWYPSSVFVGDTYTYFAGMTMAVVGVLGHYSETLLIFFLPQVLNFLLSLPQLASIIPCPRHRLPRFDPRIGLLTGTKDGTLVNVFLRLFGRRSEQSLCVLLLVFQGGTNEANTLMH